MKFQKYIIHFKKHQGLRRRQRLDSGVNHSVKMQLPSAEDGEGFL